MAKEIKNYGTSIVILTILQLVIYILLFIIGIIFLRSFNLFIVIERYLEQDINLPILFFLSLISNAIAVIVVLNLLFKNSGRNAWLSLWWSFSIQTMIIIILWFVATCFASDGFSIVKFNFIEFISLLSTDITIFFLGTIGTYAFIQFITKITIKM